MLSNEPSTKVVRRLQLPQNGVQIPKFVVFCRNFDQKPLKVCYTVTLSKNFQRQSCSTINYLSNSISVLAGNDPSTVKFGLIGTNLQ